MCQLAIQMADEQLSYAVQSGTGKGHGIKRRVVWDRRGEQHGSICSGQNRDLLAVALDQIWDLCWRWPWI